MLDKSISYFNVIMRRKAGIPIKKYSLPSGFSFVLYESGDEKGWTNIEASVDEFASTVEALHHFQKEYLPYLKELKKRMFFVEKNDGEKIATITCWWDFSHGKRIPSIHWFAVKKGYQGLGIGKALVSRCLNQMRAVEGDKDIFLHTQTWSYINLYFNAGFEMIKNQSFGQYKNDFDKAYPILNKILGGKY